MSERREEVIAGILRVVAETGITNRGKLADELNQRGVTTSTGLKWEAQPLRNFINHKGHESLKAKLQEIKQQSIVTPEEPGSDVTDASRLESANAQASPLSAKHANLVTSEEPVSTTENVATVVTAPDRDTQAAHLGNGDIVVTVPEALSIDNYDNVGEHAISDTGVNLGEQPLPPHDDKLVKDDTTFITREELTGMLEAIETRLTDMVDARTQAVTGDKVVMSDKVAMPPKPPKVGKKEHGSKDDIRARIDTELLKLFEAECKDHFGGNASTALNAILWRFYGHPPLSFELEEGYREPRK